MSVSSESQTIDTPLTTPSTSPRVSLTPERNPCILDGIFAVRQLTPPPRPAGRKSVTVFGVDLWEYIEDPSNDLPFERFLKDQDKLGEMASLPRKAKEGGL